MSAIDGTVNHGTLTTANFNNDLVAAISAVKLDIGHAMLFKPAIGDYNGDTFLIIDANGMKGYQADGDFVMLLDHPSHIANLDSADFG